MSVRLSASVRLSVLSQSSCVSWLAELQHCLIDLMETMCLEPYNVHQLLDKEFVNCMIKYASLAHLNPDQVRLRVRVRVRVCMFLCL